MYGLRHHDKRQAWKVIFVYLKLPSISLTNMTDWQKMTAYCLFLLIAYANMI